MKKKKILAIVLATSLVLSLGLGTVTNVGATNGLPDLAGLWHLDDNALDSSGNGNGGIVYGGASFVSGMFGQALSFDGVDDYVDVGDIDVDGDWTVELWAKLASSSGTIYYPGGLGPAAPNGPGIFMGGTYLSQVWGVYDGTNWVSGSTVSTDTWYHFAVTKSGTTYTLYLDGASDGTGTLADIDISDLNIGKRSDNYWYFDGMIDEVRVWSGALSAEQIGLDLFDVTVNAEGSDLDVDIDYELGSPYVGVSGMDTTEFTLESTIEGTEFTLTAPATHEENYTFYVFDHWSVNGDDYDTPEVTFTVDDDLTATAHYTMVISVDKTLEECYRLIGEVTVQANDSDGVSSSETLESGKSYILVASGTFYAAAGITADAEYSSGPTSYAWQEPVEKYESYGVDLLDLKVNDAFVDWGSYNSDHVYTLDYLGTGSTVSFLIYDLVPYSNNSGSLTVKIYEACDCNAVPLGEVVNFGMTITVHAWDDLTPDTDIYVEDGIGADLVVDSPAIGSYEDYPDTGQSVEVWKAGKGKRGATKIGWAIDDPEVCADYTLDIVVRTGLNPKDKQEYTSTGEHELNSGPEVYFTYDGTLYMLQGPPVSVNVVDDEG